MIVLGLHSSVHIPERRSTEAHKQSHEAESSEQLAFEKQSRVCVQTSAVKPSLAPSSEDPESASMWPLAICTAGHTSVSTLS